MGDSLFFRLKLPFVVTETGIVRTHPNILPLFLRMDPSYKTLNLVHYVSSLPTETDYEVSPSCFRLHWAGRGVEWCRGKFSQG